MKEKIFEDRVENNKLRPHTSNAIRMVLACMEGKRIRITIKELKRRRSSNQNRFYWGVVLPVIHHMFNEAGNTVDEETIHEYLKEHVGGLITYITTPHGERVRVLQSTTKLGTIEFEDYLTKIRAWAASFDVIIPFPNEYL